MAIYASAMLAQFDTNLALVSLVQTARALRPSGYRMTLDREPDSAADELYFLDLADGSKNFVNFSSLESFWRGTVNVQVAFHRGGGDQGGRPRGGDRRNVLSNASDDCQKIGDVLEDPDNYNEAVSGIRTVRFIEFAKDFDGKHFEVWRVTFDVEWFSQVITS